MAAAVPFTAEYWVNMVEWAGYLKDWFAANKIANPPYGQDPALTQAYYDGELCAFRVKDHVGGSSYDQWIQDEYEAYVPYYVVPAGGGVQGFRNFTDGLYEDVARGTSRSAASKSAIQLILDNSNFVRTENMADDLLSRECAYALIAIINGQRASCTIDSTNADRIPILLNWCLGHIDQWCTLLTADYFRPFMGGITAHALTHYFLYVEEDARIIPALEILADYAWDTCWKGTVGAWGQANAFTYTDRSGFDADDLNTQPDLNLLIAPLWGFLWWKTGVSTWRTNGDLIFEGSISVYNGPFYDSGSYLGSRDSSNPAGKQYDQQLIWGPKYLEWAILDFESPDVPYPDPPETGFKGVIEYGTSYAPSQYANQTTFDRAQAAPLDGSVLRVITDAGADFGTRLWGVDQFELTDLSASIAYLAQRNQLGWGRLRYNFAKVQIANRTDLILDWFTPGVNILIHNMYVLGQFAARVGLRGIWFDSEGYLPVWTYNSMSGKNSHTLEQYQAQCYQVGKIIAENFRKASPNLDIMTTSAYDGYVGRLPDIKGSEWGLWKNFLDGMLDGYGSTLYTNFQVSPGAGWVSPTPANGKIILTTEGTYGLTNIPNIIRYGVRQMNGTFDSYTIQVLPPSHAGSPAPDDRYWGGSVYFYDPNVTEIGLALNIDYPPFDPDTPGSNHWTPAAFKEALATVIENCQWCWIYNATYRFYDATGSNELPASYIDQIRDLRSEKGML